MRPRSSPLRIVMVVDSQWLSELVQARLLYNPFLLLKREP